MTELIPDFDLGEIQAPYEVHYHPNIGGGGVIPESQRNGSSTGHSLGEGTYFVQLTSNTGHTCYISYSQGVAWKVLAQTEAGDPDIFRSTDLVKLVVGPSGGTIRVTATPGHAQDDVDQRRMMSLGVFPSALYSPEAGGGGFLGGFFVWLGGQSDRAHRFYRPGFRYPRILFRTGLRRNTHAGCRGISHPRGSSAHPCSATSSRIKKSDDHLEWGGRGADSNHELPDTLGKPAIHSGHNSSRAAWPTPVNHASCKHRFKPLPVRESRGAPILPDDLSVSQAVGGDAPNHSAEAHRVGLAVAS